MNEDNEPIYIGLSEDIDIDSVENFEHEEINYAIYHLKSGFFATQGQCVCDEQATLSEGNIDGEEIECANCGRSFSIVSGDSISDSEAERLVTFDIDEEENNLYLNL